MSIKQLDTTVVNKIAAGEIVIQPSNALKELIENSIDAKSTSIDILVKDGGLKLLQISDNGTGVHKDDLGLLCHRYATSKISSFDDLNSIATYGFRGEALASISHISHLSVVTKTHDSQLAYKAFYNGGELATLAFKKDESGQKLEPKPVAGKNGTQIIVEDLFYNVPARLRAIRLKSDEFAKVLDVVGRYAVHCGHVGFSCKKFGDSHFVVATRPDMSIQDRIRTVFGAAVAQNLIEFDLDGKMTAEDDDESYLEKFGLVKAHGVFTTSDYINKKRHQPVFFINDRLVSCDPLRRALMSIYQFYLPKGSQPFMYLSLHIQPHLVDVNVHPTKREVRFLNEDEIIDAITFHVNKLFTSIDSSRKFKTQSVLFDSDKRSIDDASTSQAVKKYRQENKLVRVDPSQTHLTSFMPSQSVDKYREQTVVEATQEQDYSDEMDLTDPMETQVKSTTHNYTVTDKPRADISLDSINELRDEITQSLHRPLTNIFNNSVYVGIVDEEKRLCCFQYDVKLFLCDYAALLYEFYYQVSLAEFGNYGEFELDVVLEDVLEPLYKQNSDLVPKADIISTLLAMKEMFGEYFLLQLDEQADGVHVKSLPMIAKDVLPGANKLPFFFYRLGSKVVYNNEKECLSGILRQIALLYVPEIIEAKQDAEVIELNNMRREELNQQLESVVFPMVKRRFLATKPLLKDVVQIADLPGLYKVFERC